ncbi:LURP-one-related family protein [Ligilactobacillus faecis]|uniref:LURP-one-related family protein n=1 Tax=Ligilactobacillus faecis TaxID=762833 RepID=A0ABV4DUV2_9LACO
MRELYTKRTELSNRGTVKITDRSGRLVYFIIGKWGLHPSVLSIYDVSGPLLAEIKQRSLGLFPKFDLYENKKHVGSLRRYYGINREMLFVRGLNWFIIGNLLTFNYKVYHGRKCIMTISEVQLTTGARLEFHIENQADEPLCFCIAAILDYWARLDLKTKAKAPSPRLAW